MDWLQFCRTRLPEYLDDNGDLVPPWEQFPHYERYTIGWRMGDGEGWLGMWHVFLEDLDPAFEVRLGYLRRHRPAPVSWADWVYGVLYPESQDEGDDDGLASERRAALLQMGLIASDIAYPTWLSRQQAIRWPWESAETPEIAARYGTREFSFWSRQVAGLRRDPVWMPPSVPEAWQSCASALQTGNATALDLRRGLLSLAQMLSAGRVAAPWQVGLTLDDFANSFKDDMGYVDAFRLWGMSSFDDREHLDHYLASTKVPKNWDEWVSVEFYFD